MTESDMPEKASCCSTGGLTSLAKVKIVLAVGIVLYIVACLLPFVWPVDVSDFNSVQWQSLLMNVGYNMRWLAIALIASASFGWIRQGEK